jgi:hypothetical protein
MLKGYDKYETMLIPLYPADLLYLSFEKLVLGGS